MAQKNRIDLKSYFQTGDRPTQDQFSDLVDSFVSRTDDSFVATLPDATETAKGVAEIATLAEVQAGTDTVRMVTPAGAKKAVQTFAAAMAPVQSVNGQTGVVTITLPADSGWASPTLMNSFSNFGAPYQEVRYRKKAGVVYLEGVVKNTVVNNGAIFQLPAGFRPAKRLMFPQALANGAAGRIDVDANGNVLATGMDMNGTSICGISFVVD